MHSKNSHIVKVNTAKPAKKAGKKKVAKKKVAKKKSPYSSKGSGY